MPTIMTHAFVGAAAGTIIRPAHRSVYALSAVCATLPDADVITFRWGIPYASAFGHRGMSHSILFAALVGLGVGWLVDRILKEPGISRFRWAWFFFLVTLSHALLDACTDGGLGVALFAPFTQTRIFFPFRPIAVAPIAIARFFSPAGLQVIASELVWIWVPVIAVALFVRGMYTLAKRSL
jgi:inner membrane protein